MVARLAFDRVACLRGDRLLFEGMSFALDAGDAALLTGPNGAGKSSLMRIAAGLLPASAGTVERAGGIAFAGEAAALDPRLPLGRALGFWAKLDGASPADVDAALDRMAIANLAQVPVRMFSTGQRKRAALARVIAGRAAIWLLDEPGNGLDTASIDRLAAAMAAHRDTGGIVVVATHQSLALPGAIEIPLGTRP
ncbi:MULTISPECIES: heme ABC exporter ATP-binding protein CcmA [unclassified Sphingomonas]|uniref:heme ABC exporter ATP-binding protein CcmA n=1 Tax=unclassified Sphingomonas TaxID=196159 RepID=UPI000700309C|nr:MULTISPECIES: heme ABC exporter ATP-binding protein CcmA [unclassified Sphingomonas]KQX26263.1 cytochrome C biogenesis protein CcmA [Sphingomonas sp. Root1294]KQY69332.1 cytochrome C biogenesis protein CcmA [Sphingomonas sp. Root50]KRB89592.1 cytochrome C biogenesis protein CcmA [Sphingomonas sp. Root720]